MNRAVRYGLATVLIGVPLWLCLVALRPHSPAKFQLTVGPDVRVAPAEDLLEFAGYRQWAKVNPQPQYLASKLDFLCAAPTQQMLAEDAKNPHLHNFMQCYVNPTGTEAMLHQKHPIFPVGSVIVKEKLPFVASGGQQTPQADFAHPALLTAMVKHAAGYDPAHGDWEFVVMDGNGKHVQARGHLANCQSCHAEKKRNDYVFRDELSDAQRTLLK